MDISVRGSRTGSSDWEAVRNLSKDELPPLTPEQLEVARQLGIPEEDYARSILAGEKTTEKLLAKTEQVARVLERDLRAKKPQIILRQVTLDTWDHRFDVVLDAGDHTIPVRVSEALVDDLFERGSEDAEARISRILDLALMVRGPK